MDNVTHALAGMALANGFFRERFGRAAVPALALAANLPDIDGALLLLDRPDVLALRRTFGHSLLALPLWCGLLAWAFKKRWPEQSYPAWLGLVAAGVGLHLGLDLINSFGVVLLWPLSWWRPELAIAFIIDFVMLAILAAPLFSYLSRDWRPRLASASQVSLALLAAYLGCSWALRQRALSLLADDRAAAGREASFVYVFPEPFGPHRWRGVEKDGPLWRLYLINASGSVLEAKELPDQAEHPVVVAARATPLGKRLEGFIKAPLWSVDEAGRAHVQDLRFHSLLLERRPAFAWTFEPGAAPAPAGI